MPRTLSRIESKIILRFEWENKHIISVNDIKRILHCPKNYAYKLAHKLEEKNWLERIASGYYLLISAGRGVKGVPPMNPLLVGSILAKPYYYGYAVSNNFYGFSPQIPATIYIVTTREKRMLKWRNNEFRFVTLSKEKFFGFHKVKVLDAEVNMAEKEKTVIDSIDKSRYAGGIEEVIKIVSNAKKNIDFKKLTEYALKMKSFSLIQRLGFLLDLVNAKTPITLRKKLRKNIGLSPVYLDNMKRWGSEGKYYKEWNIICNVPEKYLVSEIRIG